jgi:hypothetical protein
MGEPGKIVGVCQMRPIFRAPSNHFVLRGVEGDSVGYLLLALDRFRRVSPKQHESEEHRASDFETFEQNGIPLFDPLEGCPFIVV